MNTIARKYVFDPVELTGAKESRSQKVIWRINPATGKKEYYHGNNIDWTANWLEDRAGAVRYINDAPTVAATLGVDGQYELA